MRVAIIDLGTNSVRFDVHNFRTGKKPRLVWREKVMVRLGEEVYRTGKLCRDAVDRTIKALGSFSSTAKELKVDSIYAVGTSALRDAADSADFVQRVKDDTGIELQIISGEEEARLIAVGVLANKESLRGYFALTDIGGGSTEVSLCKGERQLDWVSFNLGTARLVQLFPKLIPPTKQRTSARIVAVEQARSYIREELKKDKQFRTWPGVRKIIGSSGTIRALIRLQKALGKKSKRTLSRGSLGKLVNMMGSMTSEEILKLPGMDPDRIDIILGGAVLLEEVMDFLRAKKVVLTSYSLRDGLLEERLRAFRSSSDKGRTGGLAGVSKLASGGVAFFQPDHCRASLVQSRELRWRIRFGCTLYTQLQPIHRLPAKWESFLVAAVVLLDATRKSRTTRTRKLRMTALLKQNFPELKRWEREFLMTLTTRSAGRVVNKNTLRSVSNKGRRRALTYLLAMVRATYSAERTVAAPPLIDNVTVGGRKIQLLIAQAANEDRHSRRKPTSRTRAVRQKLFRKTFGRKLIVRKVAV